MKNNRNMETGKRLKEALKRANMTQKHLSEIVNYSTVAINNICAGRSALTIDNAHTFADILGCDYRYLTLESEYITVIDGVYARFDKLTLELESESAIKEMIFQILHNSDYAFRSVSEMTKKESLWMAYTLPNGSRRFARDEDFRKLIDDIAWYIAAASERFVAEHERTIENVPAKYMPDYIPKEPPKPSTGYSPSTPLVFE